MLDLTTILLGGLFLVYELFIGSGFFATYCYCYYDYYFYCYYYYFNNLFSSSLILSCCSLIHLKNFNNFSPNLSLASAGFSHKYLAVFL